MCIHIYEELWSKRTQVKTYTSKNVPTLVKTYPRYKSKRTLPMVKTYLAIGQNVPNLWSKRTQPLVKTYPSFGQNVPMRKYRNKSGETQN